MPDGVGSCHTAPVDGLVVAGHVPATDIRRALAARPKGVCGLVVDGMPLGSPGMEIAGRPVQRYTVLAFGPGGIKPFAQH